MSMSRSIAWLLILAALSLLTAACGASRAEREAQECYALGRQQYLDGRFDEAIVSFTQAGEAAVRSKDDSFRGQILLSLSDTYAGTYFFGEALSCADCAASVFGRLGDSLMVNAARYRKARSLSALGEYGEAAEIYRSLLSSRQVPAGDLAGLLSDAALLEVSHFDNRARAVSLYEEALSLAGGLEGYNHWGAYAYALAGVGETARSKAIFEEMAASGLADSYSFREWKSRTEALQGDFSTAYALLDEASQQQRSSVMRVLRQSTVQAQRDYYALRSEQARAKEQSMWIIGGLVLLILLLLLSGAILWFRSRDRKNRTERAVLFDWASSMENQRDELSLSQARLRSDYARLYQSYFQQIGRINEIVQASPEKERGVYFQLSQLIKDIRLDKRGQKQFEAMINRDLDDVMLHFREDFPSYQEDTYRFMSYVFAGFDAPTIRLLMDMASEAAVHTKKSGIKKAILSSNSPHRDYYLMLL